MTIYFKPKSTSPYASKLLPQKLEDEKQFYFADGQWVLRALRVQSRESLEKHFDVVETEAEAIA